MVRNLVLQAPDELKASRKVNLDFGGALSVVGGAITVTSSFHTLVVPSGSIAGRRIDVINGGSVGDVLFLKKDPSSPGDPVLRTGNGNLEIPLNHIMNNLQETITLVFYGVNWFEVARA